MTNDEYSLSVIEQRLARTYDHPSYEDPYEAVQDYRRVQRAVANHPEKGSAALASIVELPRSRIRGWVDTESHCMPDAARAISNAHTKGWLDPTGTTARALAALAGHLLGGGGITERNYVPSICEGRRVPPATIESVLQQLDVPTTRRHTDSDNRTTEVVPTESASLLGRTMCAWGCPVGGRDEIDALPDLLDRIGPAGQTAFLEAYILHRGVNYPDKATTRLQGEQPQAFHQAIAKLIESVTGAAAQPSDRGVTVSAAAMRALGLDE